MRPEIWVGLGSNLGDREANLRFGLERFARLGKIHLRSSVYETEPWGQKDQPPFLNAVCSCYSPFDDPAAFWAALKQIEVEAGRIPGERWGPRTLDLDLLLWGNEVFSTEHLVVPHPGIAERRFVLIPLVEIAADLIHPVSGLTVRQMLERCPDRGAVRPWSGPGLLSQSGSVPVQQP